MAIAARAKQRSFVGVASNASHGFFAAYLFEGNIRFNLTSSFVRVVNAEAVGEQGEEEIHPGEDESVELKQPGDLEDEDMALADPTSQEESAVTIGEEPAPTANGHKTKGA